MCCKGFIKRIVPFFLTFAVGLFIASFFVTIAAPSFQFKNRNWKRNHRQYDRQIEAENQRLRDENLRLRNQLAEMERHEFTIQPAFDGVSIPPPPAPPVPNVVPYRTR